MKTFFAVLLLSAFAANAVTIEGFALRAVGRTGYIDGTFNSDRTKCEQQLATWRANTNSYRGEYEIIRVRMSEVNGVETSTTALAAKPKPKTASAQCPSCGKITGTSIIKASGDAYVAQFTCGCGHAFTKNLVDAPALAPAPVVAPVLVPAPAPAPVNYARDPLANVPAERIAYKVTCQSLKCQQTSILKPVFDGQSSSRSVSGGMMVQRSLQFKCPKCKMPISETLPEQFVARKSMEVVVLPAPVKTPLLKRIFKASGPLPPQPQVMQLKSPKASS